MKEGAGDRWLDVDWWTDGDWVTGEGEEEEISSQEKAWVESEKYMCKTASAFVLIRCLVISLLLLSLIYYSFIHSSTHYFFHSSILISVSHSSFSTTRALVVALVETMILVSVANVQ